MKKALMTIASVLAIMMVFTGAAYSWDMDEHVKAAPNGEGDLIIFPYYFAANGGWETQITVQNTDLEHSVVAKVVFRSHYYSEELLDFLLYLTPADVWTGYIRNDGSRTYIYSEDDSALSTTTTWASKANPINQALFNPTCTSKDSRDWGYIEVIQSWYGNTNAYVGVITKLDSESAVRPVSKSYLKRIYDKWLAAGSVNNVIEDGCPGFNRSNGINDDAAVGFIPSGDHTINVLAAHMQFQNPLMPGMTAAMRAYVFADYDCLDKLNAAVVTGLQTINARNTIGELEAAMAKSNLALPYVNNASGDFSVHMITFPTKISKFTNCTYNDGTGPFWDDPSVGLPAAGTTATAAYASLLYTHTYFDMQEKSKVVEGSPYSGGDKDEDTLPEEVNLLTTLGYASDFNEGWTLYDFRYTDRYNNPTVFCPKGVGAVPCTVTPTQDAAAKWKPVGVHNYLYYGTPVLSSVLKFVNGGIKMMEGAWTDDYVFAGDYSWIAPGAPVATPGVNDIVTTGDMFPAAGAYNWMNDYQYFNIYNEKGRESFGTAAAAVTPVP